MPWFGHHLYNKGKQIVLQSNTHLLNRAVINAAKHLAFLQVLQNNSSANYRSSH
jgi:hypothetical protein